jgi:hypothetical protein
MSNVGKIAIYRKPELVEEFDRPLDDEYAFHLCKVTIETSRTITGDPLMANGEEACDWPVKVRHSQVIGYAPTPEKAAAIIAALGESALVDVVSHEVMALYRYLKERRDHAIRVAEIVIEQELASC